MSDAYSFDPTTGNQDFSGGSSTPSFTTGDAGGLAVAAGGLLGAAGTYVAGQAASAGDKATAAGYGEESKAYTEAAGYSAGNVQLAQESTAIQQYQQQRLLAKTVGRQQAEIAADNLGPGGSGTYLLRSSMAQGALATGLIGVQGAINEQGYASQESTNLALANQATGAQQAAQSASSSSSTASTIGAIGGVAGALGGIIGLVGKFLP